MPNNFLISCIPLTFHRKGGIMPEELSDLPSMPPEIDCIKLVRLVTGEDILCVMRDEIREDMKPTDEVILSTPLKLIMHRVTPLRPATAMAIGIIQWLPDELLENHAATIKVGHIITIMEPKEELKAYYKKTVDLIHMNMMREDKSIREGITTASIDAGRLVEAEQVRTEKTRPSIQERKRAVVDAADAEIDHLEHLLAQLHELDVYLTQKDAQDEEGPITFH